MNTTCKAAELWISIRLDGESLPDAEGKRLDEHLATCVRCRDLLAAEARRSSLLRGALALGAPEGAGLRRTILEELVRDPTGARRTGGAEVIRAWRRPILGLAVAAAAACGVLAVAWWDRAPPPGGSGAPLLTEDAVRNPSSPATSSAPGRDDVFRILVEDRWVDPTHPADGRGRFREFQRVRDILLAPRSKSDPGPDGHDVILDTERVDSRYVQFTDWTYH